MKPYPKYKDSGIEWLGEVPVHWLRNRIKYVSKVLNGSTPSSSEPDYWDGEISWATPDDLGALNSKYLHETKRKITEEGYLSCGTTLAPRNNVVLSTRAPIGHIAISENAVCCNQGCRILIPRKCVLSDYLYYVLYSSKSLLEALGQGSTFKELNRDTLTSFELPFPTLEDQQAIAAYLDRETARIDALIQKKERMIELLKEKRVALITQAVTKGLDPDVPMKDSGIEWLGLVPEHWEVKKFIYACVLQRGFDLPSESFVEGDYPVLGSNGVIGFHNVYTTAAPNVTVGRSGSVGKVNYISTEFWAHNTSLFVLDSKNNHMKWIYYLLLSIDMESVSEGSAVPTLNRNYIHRMMITIPPRKEQITISDQLDCFLSRIENMIAKIETSISLLREYRASLIHHAVTGKIDLRDHGNAYHD